MLPTDLPLFSFAETHLLRPPLRVTLRNHEILRPLPPKLRIPSRLSAEILLTRNPKHLLALLSPISPFASRQFANDLRIAARNGKVLYQPHRRLQRSPRLSFINHERIASRNLGLYIFFLCEYCNLEGKHVVSGLKVRDLMILISGGFIEVHNKLVPMIEIRRKERKK